MVHFNELYITEDGNNLVIDVGIDNDPVYDGCYIDKITVSLKDDCDDTTNSTVVYTDSGVGGTTYVDINGDGVIDYVDITIIDWLQSYINSMYFTPDEIKKYDLNEDGFVDLRDVEFLLNVIKTQTVIDTRYDLSGDGEVTVADDVQVLIDLILNKMGQEGIIVPHSVIEKLVNEYKKLIDSDDAEKVVGNNGKRRVRLCLPNLKQPLDFVKGSLSNHLFLVTVEAGMTGDSSAIDNLGCGWDQYVARGLAYDTKRLYDTAISYASSYGDSCDNNDSSAFLDFILRYYAFMFAIKCGDVDQACYYWNNYLKRGGNAKSLPLGGGCGCHGAYR